LDRQKDLQYKLDQKMASEISNVQQILEFMVRQRPQTDELPYNALLKENKKDVTSDLMNVGAKENANISRYMKDYNWYASLLMYNSF
jgi:hypothetical protein